MKLLKTALLTAFIAPLMSMSAQAAQLDTHIQRAATGTVHVLVHMNGRPVSDASVMLHGGDGVSHEYMTNSHGRVVINALDAPGNHAIAAAKAGMEASDLKKLSLLVNRNERD